MKNNRVKTILKYCGIVLLLTGFILTIVGFIDFFNSVLEKAKPALLWCMFLGLPFMGLGSGFSFFAFKRELITSQEIHQQKPCENVEISIDSQNIPHSNNNQLEKTCAYCGKILSSSDVYCSSCGNKL